MSIASIKDYHPKAIPGLYTFDHWEHESGAFIQASIRRDVFIHCLPDGHIKEFHSLAALKTYVESL